ncbi:MAG TPA: hypothetical protein PK662_03680, partial [Bacteroidales bacterium]|nr:hypothetical protein [Bacteroidales bacterium]
SDGSLEYKETCKFDEKGNKIEIEYSSYNSDGSLEYKETCKFDEKGKLIEKYLYNSKYNPNAVNPNYEDEKSENRYIWENQDKLEVTWSYKYDYDEKGNWITKICFKNQIPMFMLERTYSYYE